MYFEIDQTQPTMNSLLYLLSIVAAIWVIYDVWAVNKKLSGGMKLMWTLLALLFSFITAIVYYLLHKSK